MSKSLLEKSLWNQASGEVSHYHVDNGIFTATEYRHGCNKKGHSKILSGVGAQHQTARSECYIQTVMYMVRACVVHALLHWSERVSYGLYLWYLTAKHLVWLYNRLSSKESGLNTLESLTKTKSYHCNLL